MPWANKNSNSGTWARLSRAFPLSRDHVRAKALFRSDSFWFQPLPDSPPTDANNTNLRATLAAHMATMNLDRTAYTPQVAIATNDDPVVTFTFDTSLGWAEHPDLIRTQLTGLHIPRSAAPAGGTDQELIVYNRDTGQMTDIWLATKVDDLNWKAGWAGTISDVSKSNGIHTNPFGAVASGLAFLPGMITPDELAEGWIGHVIGIGIKETALNGNVSVPATRTDGKQAGANLLSEGQRLFLPRSANLNGLNRTERVIARAAQEFGFIIWDLGPSSAFTIRALNPAGMSSDPYPDLLVGHSNDPLANFPWRDLQVMPMNWMPA